MEMGAEPRIAALSTLSPGISSRSEVLLALGEPRGHGAVRIDPRPETRRGIWYYELVRTDGSEVSLKILLVFIDGDRYDGHIWFDSSAYLETDRSWK